MHKTFLNFASLMIATSGLASASAAYADSTDIMKKFLIDDATPYLDLRYRFEHIDQDSKSKDANASTLRTKLGYKTGTLHDFSAVLEFENVVKLGSESYNDTVNGRTSYPTVADPDGTELNMAYLQYAGIPDTVVRIGRQDHNLDNQRFIGTVGWRQNDQMYDSAMLTNTSLKDTTLIYSFVTNVNRIFGDDHPLGDLSTSTHVFNASYNGWEYGKLTGYGYLIDLDDAAVVGLSSKTFGLRFTGSAPLGDDLKALYTAEYARQSDHGDNPTNYDADYWTLEAGLGYKGLVVKAGYEELGSDNGGTTSFQTPLATGHKFNGWADKFLTTPGTGLEDIYGSVYYTASGTGVAWIDDTTFGATYHDFSAETGGADYGDEWDLAIKRKFMKHYSVLFKFVDYDADTVSSDTQKFVVQLGAKF